MPEPSQEHSSARQPSDACLTAVLDRMEELVLITDTHGIIRYVNRAFQLAFGYKPQEILGKRPDMFVVLPQNHEAMLRALTSLRGRDAMEYRLSVQSKHGSVIEASVSISALQNDQGDPCQYLCIAYDLSRERQLQKQLHEAQRMEAMGQLARGIAHRFNNVLGAISGQAEMLQLRAEADSFFRDRAGRLLDCVQNGQELVAHIQAFTRKQSLHSTPVDVSGLMRQVMRFLEQIAPAGIELRSIITDEPCHIMGVPEELHQVILNLANNAIESMSNGGELEVSLKNVEETLAPEYGEASARRVPAVRIRVRDTGQGISAADEPHIYEPFYTTRKHRSAIGMGLTVVRATLARYHGKIQCYSAPAQGTVFEVYLPRHISESDADRDLFGPRGRGEKILLMDDEPFITEAGSNLLLSLGYQVHPCNDPEALECLLENEHFDLIILDMSLPGLDGLRRIRKLRESGIHTPTILTTPLEMMPQPWECAAAAIERVLPKPCPARELTEAVRAVCDQRGK